MKAICKSDMGLVRASNQDWVEIRNYSNGSCLSIVCDGIGGEAGGDVASKEAAHSFIYYFENNMSEDIKSLIFSSINNANQRIIKIGRTNRNISNLGTTLVIAFIENNILHVANIGDSRAYIVSSSDIIQVTKDHSVVNELISKGIITPGEAKDAPSRNIITRALGSINYSPDYYTVHLKENEKILLCTDGLTNCVDDSDIKRIINENIAEEAIEILIDTANNNGGIDNITVSLIF